MGGGDSVVADLKSAPLPDTSPSSEITLYSSAALVVNGIKVSEPRKSNQQSWGGGRAVWRTCSHSLHSLCIPENPPYLVLASMTRTMTGRRSLTETMVMAMEMETEMVKPYVSQ